MNYLKIFFTALASVAALFILSKFMGNKQISQMNMFDYIVGISIGSIAAEMATNLEQSSLMPLIAMVVYAVVALSISVITDRSVRLRKIIAGKPVVLMDSGEIYKENLKKSRLDLGEFLTCCRIAGYFDLNDIQTAVFEHNGVISFLPRAGKRPSQPNDFGLLPKQEYLLHDVILDGQIISDELRCAGRDEKWLMYELSCQGVNNEKDVFLATCDRDGILTVYKKHHTRHIPEIY